MTQNEVINKLSMEMALAVGDMKYLETYRWYIRQALVIGCDHFSVDMEEIIQMDRNGVEIARYKSIGEASRKTGLFHSNISDVVNSKQHSAGGFLFVKTKDKELVPAKKTA